ncbi:hypothetical protein P8452_00319 [Trifolium repens]|nr:hypothetical protein P8452_00319 [Trifolium repens]
MMTVYPSSASRGARSPASQPSIIVNLFRIRDMEGEVYRENPEDRNFDLERDDVSDGSDMSSPYGNSNEIESENAAEEEIVVVRDMTDIQKLVADNFRLADITKYEFVSLDVAYMFYCWFAKMSGFAVRPRQPQSIPRVGLDPETASTTLLRFLLLRFEDIEDMLR